MSLLHFLYYIHSAGGVEQLVETRGGAQHEHVVGGTAQICSRLVHAIEDTGQGRVLTCTPVTSIDGWDKPASQLGLSDAFPVCVTAHVRRSAAPAATDHAGPGRGASTGVKVRLGAHSVDIASFHSIRVLCKRVIVATPPSVCNRIRFHPTLPAVRRQLHARVLMPCMSKFVLRYPTAWWRDAGMSGEAVCYQPCASSPLCTMFDYCQPVVNGKHTSQEAESKGHDEQRADESCGAGGVHAALVGFAAGNASLALTRLSKAERKAAVVASFVSMFGPAAKNFTEYFEMQWEVDEWSSGCPVNVFPAGQFLRFANVVRAPVGRLHWAGTETATVWTGYMDGAVQSGARAAQELVVALNADTERVLRGESSGDDSSGDEAPATKSREPSRRDDGYVSEWQHKSHRSTLCGTMKASVRIHAWWFVPLAVAAAVAGVLAAKLFVSTLSVS